MIDVFKVSNHRLSGLLDGEYVGRAMSRNPSVAVKIGSVLGNPFKPASRTEEDHLKVCERYKAWLWAHISESVHESLPVLKELQRLKLLALQGDLILLCWCKPLPCHADVIANCLRWAIETDFEFV